MEDVEYYESSPEKEEAPLRTQKQGRKRKRTILWNLEKTFPRKSEAVDFVQNEQTWSINFTNSTFEGRKVYYRCNKVKRRGEQCQAELYLFYDNTSLEVHLFRSEGDHTCKTMASQSQRLTQKLKTEIERLFDLKNKPKRIHQLLVETGFEPKDVDQVKNYLRQYKLKKYGPARIHLHELEEWCIKNSDTPSGEDLPFVYAFDIQYGDDSDLSDSGSDEASGGMKFRIAVSTLRLLKQAESTDRLHADATYKMNWEGMPVMVIGSSDMDRHFHPICICVCSDEQTSTFLFLFQSLKNQLPLLNPKYLISDAAGAIRQAFISVFGGECIMCWAHMYRCYKKHLHLVESEQSREDLKKDIKLLQLCPDPETFKKASQLFFRKWKSETKFLEYLNKVWFGSLATWYEGFAFCVPSTNNALESFNLVIKLEETLREKLPLSQFKDQLLESASNFSKYYLSRVVIKVPTLKLSDWTGGYQWAKASKKLSADRTSASEIQFFCPGNVHTKSKPIEKSSLTERDINRFTRRTWTDWKQFEERAFAVAQVSMDESNWKLAKCTCEKFQKEFKCKHVIGVAIRRKLVQPPPAAKQIPIGQVRGPGRPPKAKPKRALLVD